jgi:hypothetical protein
MRKFKLDCAYIISKFESHDVIKEKLLKEIACSEGEHAISHRAEVDISRTDWYCSSDFSRKWVNCLSPYLLPKLQKMYLELGYDGLTIPEIWFQQYFNSSQHGWHTHSGNFTNVYYLELPEDSPKTQIVNAYNQKDIIELDVKEGDLAIFPSFVVHRAPINKSNDRKTIISFNVNALYSDDIYGKGIDSNAILQN